MAIEKFLAMEEGEPGYTKTGTVAHVPFPAGGNGIQTATTGAGKQNPSYHPHRVDIPFDASQEVFIEFTSLGVWALEVKGPLSVECGASYTVTEVSSWRNSGQWDYLRSELVTQSVSIPETLHRWGVHIVVSNTPSVGLVAIYCDGVSVQSRNFDTSNSGGTSLITSVVLSAPYETRPKVATFDSIVISTDAFQGDCHVDYLVPDGNGDTSQWVGSDGNSVDNWQLVDEMPPSATDYVEADATDLRDLYTVTNLPASGTILGVQAVVHPWKLGPGTEIPTSTILKTAAGEQVDLIEGISTDIQGLEAPIKTTRPGGGAWTVADINNLQIGVTTEGP